MSEKLQIILKFFVFKISFDLVKNAVKANQNHSWYDLLLLHLSSLLNGLVCTWIVKFGFYG